MNSTPHYVRSAGLGVVAALIGLELSGWIGFVLTDLHNHSDFPMYYRAAMLVRTGQAAQLYAPHEMPYGYTHPAFEAFLFVPLTLLSIGWAYLAWTVVNVALVITSARLLYTPALEQVSPAGALGVLLAFFPISFTLMNGQDSVLVLLFTAWSYRELSLGRLFRSGIILGLTVLRFQFLFPFLVVLILLRVWKVVQGSMVSSFALLLISALITGVRGQVIYVHLVHDLMQRSHEGRDNFATMGTIQAVLSHINLQHASVPLSLIAVAVTVWRGSRVDNDKRFLFAVALTCVLNPYLYAYDLSLLALPITVFSAWLVNEGRWQPLLLPLAALAFPLLILLTYGAKGLWLCGLIAPALLAAMLGIWNTREFRVDAVANPGATELS